MFLLILLWLCVGMLVGLIANAANLYPATQPPLGRLRMALLGAGAAFVGGWLGVLLLGRPFATLVALWIAIVCVAGLPWLFHRIKPLLPKRSVQATR